MQEQLNTTRIIVNFLVAIFVIVVLLTVLLLLLYYLTPNNYVIISSSDSNKIFVKEFNMEIKPNSNIIIPIKDSNNYLLKFEIIENLNKQENLSKKIDSFNDIQLLITNIFKSQSIIYSSNDLIQTRYGSQIIIPNKSDIPIKIKISLWN